MVFSSKVFIFVFFPLTLFIYYLTPRRMKNYSLLVMSLLFYAFGEPVLVVLMVSSIFINYLFALAIAKTSTGIMSKLLLSACVVFNIGMLIAYKYLAFFAGIANMLFGTELSFEKIALPIGISFYTFQTLSYVIDVYRNNVKAQKNPFKLGTYVSFFPQLIAGPIVRYSDIASEIDERSVSLNDFVYGVRRFTIGLSKKVLLADTFARCADKAFALGESELTSPIAWIGVLAYAFQIYFDFSGYSDMAIGMGRMFGFHFVENFNYPYISNSLTEFWRRWHISLSTWFRDYLYIPLGGNQRGNVYVNLFIVFLLTGLWHGASVTFVLWGLWHGAFLMLERLLKKKGFELERVPSFLRHLATLLIILLGWVLFRSDSAAYAVSYVKAMFGTVADGFKPYNIAYFVDLRLVSALFIGFIACTDVIPRIRRWSGKSVILNGCCNYSSLILVSVLLLLNILFIMNQGYSPFIYFRF